MVTPFRPEDSGDCVLAGGHPADRRRAVDGQVAETLDVLGVTEQEAEVVVDRPGPVLAAVVGRVLPAGDGGEQVVHRVRPEGPFDDASALRVEPGPAFAGRDLPRVEDLNYGWGGRGGRF